MSLVQNKYASMYYCYSIFNLSSYKYMRNARIQHGMPIFPNEKLHCYLFKKIVCQHIFQIHV